MALSTALISRRRVVQAGIATGVAAMVPSPASARPTDQPGFSFLVLGDWGRANAGQRQVANQMARTAKQDGSRFVISTGDNFYERGVAGTDDPLWKQAFEDIYADPALMCPWYPVLGNHDHKTNAMAQVAYSQISSRWTMPGPFFWHREQFGDGSKADFFFIDTNPILEENHGIGRVFPGDDDLVQLQWLEQALATSQARWKVVIGHHPIFAGGHHGSTPELIRTIEPLFRRYKVNAYFNGHDHDLQHVVSGGIHYLTSGAGAQVSPVRKIPGTLFAQSELGFIRATLTPSEMRVDFIGATGALLYSSKLPEAA
jgi:acid phosphatase